VYIARDEDNLIEGMSNDLIAEENLLNYESNWTTNYKIVWFVEIKSKIEAYAKLKSISAMSDSEKLKMIFESQKIIIMSEEIDIDIIRLIDNVKKDYYV
jgi:hypothetical protein